MIANEIKSRIIGMRNETQAKHLMRFFKCGKGEYGEGDQFLGLRVPQTRAIVKEYRKMVSLSDTKQLVKSSWHEVRLAGFLLMIELYRHEKKESDENAREVVKTYIGAIDRANNWDLVDLTATYILGDWLVNHSEERCLLDSFSEMNDKLWHQRVAIVATFALIRNGEYHDTIRIAQKYLKHRHDLIHKATGWMLREIGKRGGEKELRNFLNDNLAIMPRTMLRYAIEKFSEEERKYYLQK